MANETNSRPRLSVVIPVFNERATVEELLRRVAEVAIDKEIVIVDDGSTDGTREILHKLETAGQSALASPGNPAPRVQNMIRVFLQEKNQGKGAALRRGLQEASGEILLIQDADLEYDPKDYFTLLAPIDSGAADVVYGSRFLGGPHRVLFFRHAVGNNLLTFVSNLFSNLNLTDVWTCYKVFRREVLAEIQLCENRFGFEPEVTAKIAKHNWRIYEVPISYNGRTYAEGKKITWRDGFSAIRCVLQYSLFD
jgi:glycosyltransferase involved in cell wall biosynthesis